MALDDFNTDQPDEAESSDGENSVAYLYIRRADDEEAYNLMSSKHGGSARVRNALKALNDYEDQHDFFQQFIKSIEPVLYEGNWVPMLEEVGLTAEGIAQYLDEHPEVEEELRELFETTEEVTADD